jgi:hypothetical protein
MKSSRSISGKLYFLVALTALSLAALIGTAVLASGRMGAAGTRLYEAGVQSKGRVDRIATLWERLRGQVTRVPAELDLEKQKQYQAAFAAALADPREPRPRPATRRSGRGRDARRSRGERRQGRGHRW